MKETKSLLKGGLLVALGAASYGVLTTFVKMAYKEGYTTQEVTFAQLFLGFVGLLVISTFYKGNRKRVTPLEPSFNQRWKLMISGTSLGLTSIFYYLSVQYVSVSVGIVLLMQSVWIGVVLDSILTKTKPSLKKIISVIVILTGTLLATNLIVNPLKINFIGIIYGFLAAISYTVTIYTSNRVATELPSITRSKWMLLGGLIIVTILVFPSLIQGFNFSVFYKWGLILALFGTIFPPLLMTEGMPKINVGLGVIITSIELPVAVLMAYFLLNEVVSIYQWLGIFLILISIVIMNLKKT